MEVRWRSGRGQVEDWFLARRVRRARRVVRWRSGGGQGEIMGRDGSGGSGSVGGRGSGGAILVLVLVRLAVPSR